MQFSSTRTSLFASTLALALLVATSAQAEPVALTCPGTAATHYTPGINNTPRLIDISTAAVHGPCAGLPLGIVSARLDLAAQGTLSCGLLTSASNVITVHWSDGTYSKASGTTLVRSSPLGQSIVVTQGTIIEGRFLGALLTRTSPLVQLDVLACMTPEGSTDVAGPSVLAVTGL